MTRNLKVQVLRAIAIFCVVVIHTYPYNQLGLFLRPVVNFAVPMFIFLSGYLTKLDNLNPQEFCKKRIIRIIIPYTIWSVFYTIYYGSYSSFIYNYVMGKSIFPFYYIIAYLQLVVITPLLPKLINSKYKNIGFWITPIALSFKIIKTILGFDMGIFNHLWSFLEILRWFSFYYLGIMLSNGKIRIDISYKKLYILWGITYLIQLGSAQVWNLLGDYSTATTAGKPSAMITSVCVLLLAYKWLNEETAFKKGKIADLVIKIGDYSFGIYLIHVFVLELINTRYVGILALFPMNTIVCLSVTFAICFVLSKLLGKKISRYLGLR